MTFLSIAIGLCIGAFLFDKFYNHIGYLLGILVAISVILLVIYYHRGDGKYEITQGSNIYYTDEYIIDEQQNTIMFHSNCCDKDIILYGTFSIAEKKDK